MVHLRIKGGNKISGEVLISGAKNSSMPILISSILTKEEVILHNVPYVSDVTNLISLLINLQTRVSLISPSRIGKSVSLTTARLANNVDFSTEASKIRTSVLLMGPSLARNGYFRLFKPGGCNIGERKIDLHVMGMKLLGAEVNETENYIEFTTHGKPLKGNIITFPLVSVGATQNVIMAATLAQGETIIQNAAIEPEIEDLILFLNKMGAKISKISEREIKIIGVKELFGTEYTIMPDRIEALTYVMIAVATGGNELILKNVSLKYFGDVINTLKTIGVELDDVTLPQYHFGGVLLKPTKELLSTSVETAPFPGFATDLQPLFMVLMLRANGQSEIVENIFENRFQHIPFLKKMGADIDYIGSKAIIRQTKNLIGSEVEGTDLRACAALAMAGLMAEGETIVRNIESLDRGYYNFVKNIINCGGVLERIS